MSSQIANQLYAADVRRNSPMHRVLFTCRVCRLVRAFDYTECGYRQNANGAILSVTDDLPCPCGCRAQGAKVQGRTSDHVCDRSCTHARGTKCECSCGGAGHGSAYLPKDEDTDVDAIANGLAKARNAA